MADIHTISKAHMHAYLDGQLDEKQRRLVEAYLEENPAELEEIRQNLLINKNLHELFDPIMQRPIPDKARELLRDESHHQPDAQTNHNGTIPPSRSFRINTLWQSIAAGVMLFIGGVLGWMYHAGSGESTSTQFESLTQLAVDAHRIYSQEKRHAVEVNASDAEHLMKWLSTRLDSKVGPADLRNEGFELLGGRLLPALGKPAGVYMYENAMQKRLSVYISIKPESSENLSPSCTVTSEFINVCTWNSRNLSYFVVGKFPIDQLKLVADSVKQQSSDTLSIPK